MDKNKQICFSLEHRKDIYDGKRWALTKFRQLDYSILDYVLYLSIQNPC